MLPVRRSAKGSTFWRLVAAFLFGVLYGRNTVDTTWSPVQWQMVHETAQDLYYLRRVVADADDDQIQPEDSEDLQPTFVTTNEIRNKVGRWPNPTIVVGFPKAGTSSIAAYFRCGGIENVVHHRCMNRACGAIIQKNIEAGRNPFLGTGKADVYIQIDVELNVDRGLPCYFPQIEALQQIHRAHPNSTFILNTRDVHDWVQSLRSWAGMANRLVKCNITGLPAGSGTTDSELRMLYFSHLGRVRRFVKRFPSHRLIEVPIDVPEAGPIMEAAFGIDSERCWGHHNSNTKG
jgi:hypothetical protein